MPTPSLALELAQRHMPILVFSRDGAGRPENFFPMDAEAFIRSAALYTVEGELVVPRGQLTPEKLLELPSEATSDLYLTVAGEPLLRKVHIAVAPPMRRPTWFARLDRLRDDVANFVRQVALWLLRGRVSSRLPEPIWREALRRYAAFDIRRSEAPPPVLYYALTEAHPYLVLHFWVFYAFNDWGTGHDGYNDHEGDWEAILLFLDAEPPHTVRWLAYAQHDGVDLEDARSPDVEWCFEHPIVYVGCGSHAAYFTPGVHGGYDFALGNAGIAIGPPKAVLYQWPRLPVEARPRRWRHWRLHPLAQARWAWHFRGHWGVRAYPEGWPRWLPLPANTSGPGGPVWLAGENRQRPQWADPLGWAGFRRHFWEVWKPSLPTAEKHSVTFPTSSAE